MPWTRGGPKVLLILQHMTKDMKAMRSRVEKHNNFSKHKSRCFLFGVADDKIVSYEVYLVIIILTVQYSVSLVLS